MKEIKKALTFSYDDGVTQDERLIKIFNKYNLKATFNINSGRLGEAGELFRDGVHVNHTKVSPTDVKRIYEGHEIAVHTVTHPTLQTLTDEEIIHQVEADREALSALVGYDVRGMAYPNCAPDDRVVRVVKEKTGVRYSRSTVVTYGYDAPADMHDYHGTLYHHRDWDRMLEMGKEFLELDAEKPQIMYIWGHAYEFDIYPERWQQLESFCEMISNRNDIFYGTNIQVFEKFNLI